MPKRSTILMACAIITLAISAGSAQEPLPVEVIEECNAKQNASELPDCLKEGSIAFEMLALARDNSFFGDDALPVIEICQEQNDTYHTTWICFENALEKAVETRELIGLENIVDNCVAGISDEDIYGRLDAVYREKRKQRFPDVTFFGGDMYHPFRGCSE